MYTPTSCSIALQIRLQRLNPLKSPTFRACNAYMVVMPVVLRNFKPSI